MSPETVLLVQQSFRWLLPAADRAGAAFLARLGREAPEAARLVPAARPDQLRRLIAGFAFVIGTLDDFENMRPALQAAGARLRARGAEAEHFRRFGAVLLCSLEQALGRVWNPHLAHAWTEAVEELVQAMLPAGADRRAAA